MRGCTYRAPPEASEERTRVRPVTSDGCPHVSFATSLALMSIDEPSPRVSVGCPICAKNSIGDDATKRTGTTTSAVWRIIRLGSTPAIKSHQTGGDPYLPSQYRDPDAPRSLSIRAGSAARPRANALERPSQLIRWLLDKMMAQDGGHLQPRLQVG